MAIDNSIFGFPFQPNGILQPKPEQMDAFLESAFKDDGKSLHGDDLIYYRLLLKNADIFEQMQLQDTKREDLQKQMVYAVLRYSRFANHNFLSAMELFKYHLQTLKLKSIDFNTPASFIQSTDRTMSRFKQPSSALTLELYRIVEYIRNALAKIEKRCEASIAILSDLDVIGKKKNRIIDDIKERPQNALLAGKIAMQDFERAIREVNLIADKVSFVVQEDIYALKDLYKAIQGHLRKTRQMIEIPRAAIRSKQDRRVEEQQQLFSTIEQIFVALLSTHHVEQSAPDIHTGTAYEKFITNKRKEMLGYLFEVFQKDRISQPERRFTKARRNSNESSSQGPNLRSGRVRRTGTIRRKSTDDSS